MHVKYQQALCNRLYFSHELGGTDHECQNILEEGEIRVDSKDKEHLPREDETWV